LGSLFRYHTRLAALDWIMSAFGFAFSALIASRRTRLVRACADCVRGQLVSAHSTRFLAQALSS
jgi:hypothetical protein